MPKRAYGSAFAYGRKTRVSPLKRRRTKAPRSRKRATRRRGRRLKFATSSPRRTTVPVSASRGISIWPKVKYMRHKYKCVLRVPAYSGLNLLRKIQTFRASSLYDPNYSATTGNTASHFTAMKDLYGRYRVIGSKMYIRIFQTNADQNIEPIVLMCKLDDNLANADNTDVWTEWITDRHTKYVKVVRGPNVNYGYKLVNNFSMKKFFGAHALSDKDYAASGNANPTNSAYWALWFVRQDGTANDTSAFNLEVTIHYFVKWTLKTDVSRVPFTDYKDVSIG